MNYPQYEMIINGNKAWLSKRETIVTWDSNWDKVAFGYYLIEKEGALPREMTEKEKDEIVSLADDYGASK